MSINKQSWMAQCVMPIRLLRKRRSEQTKKRSTCILWCDLYEPTTIMVLTIWVASGPARIYLLRECVNGSILRCNDKVPTDNLSVHCTGSMASLCSTSEPALCLFFCSRQQPLCMLWWLSAQSLCTVNVCTKHRGTLVVMGGDFHP